MLEALGFWVRYNIKRNFVVELDIRERLRNRDVIDMRNVIYSYEQLQNMINPIIKKYKALDAFIFGSYARNEASENSDIDLVVIGGNEFEKTNIFAIAEELHILSGKRVDVYEISEINEGSVFYEKIIKERISVQ